MKKLITALAVASASLGIAESASAADMVVKARPAATYDPCGVARFTGFYAGGNAGAAAYTANRNDLDGFLTDNGSYTANKIGATAGVQVGYDWQSCNKVFGVVADLNWASARTNSNDEPNDPADPDQGFKSKLHWFSTIRARAGLAVDDTLFYVTGGLAAARIKSTVTEGSTVAPEVFTSNDTRWGLAAGAGAEFALRNNWSVNAEVLYLQFQKDSVTFISAGNVPVSFDLNDSAWVARVGLNYRWDNPRAAYAASMPVKGAAPLYPCGPHRFNGPYVGGNVGGVSYTADRNDLDGYLTDNGSYTATKSGGTAGAQIGWDWQSCHKVFGVVADWNWASAKANTREEPNDPTDPDQGFKSKLSWFSTLRARAGLVADDSMIYVTAGLAAAKIKTTITEGSAALGNEVNTFDKTRWGLAAGVGAEFALWAGWSVNTELLYMQFSKQSVSLTSPATAGNRFSFDFNDSAWVSRIGLNYRWDNARNAYAAAGPVRGYPGGVARFNGFYIGGNVGGVSYQADRNDLDGYFVDNSGWSATKSGLTAGVQVGFDWQSGHRLLGVVADWNWTDVEAVTPSNPNTVGTIASIRSNMDWFSTLRTRSGVVVGDTMVYVTGGLAAARIQTTYSESIAGAFSETFSFDKTRWGWTGGAGAEFALWDNWSANAEVLYMQFRKETVTFNSPNNGGLFSFDNNDSAWVARVGLNYRWAGMGKGPVVAKY